jgi:two-component system, sensor histidine kinase and response regulator
MKHSVFVVDDDKASILAIESYLSDLDLSVRSTTVSSEAWQLFQTIRPSVIILDVLMPDPDGFTLCKKIKESEEFRNVPVIFLTSMESIAERVLELEPEIQPDAILCKPVQKSTLHVTIRAMLRIYNQYVQLTESLEHMKSLEKLRDNMVNMLAHDMRHPLQSIYGYCAFIDGSLKTRIPVCELARNIKSHAYRLNQMLQNFLDVGRLESNNLPLFFEELNIREVLDNCYDHMQAMATSKKVRIELSYDDPDTVFMGDSMIISRILDNLVNNAIKYSDKEMSVLLRSEIRKDQNNIVFSVMDRGPGVKSEYKDKIFEKFAAADLHIADNKPSVGLGLAFCKLAIKAHKGNIWVDDRPGGGSVFNVIMPISPDLDEHGN